MTDRDDELGRALGGLPVPDHAPDFWARLDRQIDEQAADGVGADGVGAGAPGTGSGGGVTVEGAHPGADHRVVPLRGGDGGSRPGRSIDDRGRGGRGNRGRWGGLAAAAAVVVLAGGAVLVTQLGDGDDGDDVVTVADDGQVTTTGAASTLEAPDDGTSPAPPAPSGDPSALGTVEPIGSGLVVGALPSATGSPTILVQDLLPGGELGCEGAPLEGLQLLGAGGGARPVPSADGTAIVNGVDVMASPGGDRVAVLSQCEGFLGQLLVGEVGPDGVPTDLQAVAGSDADGDPVPGAPQAEGAPSVNWSADGSRLLLTTAGFAAGGTAERALWSYDVASGAWTERTDAPTGVVAAVERSDGSLVAITEDALVVGDEAQPRRGANGLSLSPDGSTVAAFGVGGLLLVDETGGVAFRTAGPVNRAEFLPDGTWLAFSRFSEAEGVNEIATLPVTGGQPEPSVLGTSVWGRFEVLPDGSGLLVTVDGGSDGTGSARPAVERWAFAGT